MRWAVAISVALILIAVSFPAIGAPAPRTITVSAPTHDCAETPVSTSLACPSGAKGTLLQDSAGTAVPCQSTRDGSRLVVTWIAPAMTAGSSKTYRVMFTDKPASPGAQGVVLKKAEKAVDVMLDGKLFTSYVFSGEPKPYCYPIIGPTGKMVTRNYPMKKVAGETTDHPRHRSFWFTFGDVNGIDFWTESDKAGKTVQRSFQALEGGPVMGRIRTVNDWIAPDGKKVCEDVRELRIYRASAGRLMDFDVTVRATEGPVRFGDTKEGMMGVRVADSMAVDRKQGHIVNSRGQKDGDAWGMPAEWCDYYGPVDGDTVGIAMMDHPSSFRYPTYWHVRTYGLFAANPFGLKDFPNGKGKDGSYTIQKGGAMRFRYRIFIHNGTAEEADIGRVDQTYADPPVVTVK